MEQTKITREKVFAGVIWKFAERIGAQGVGLIVSIALARLLSPEAYGTIALIQIFITILSVFVSSGFGSALMQKQKADDLDYSSVFYFQILFSIVLYGILFASAPFIAKFYNNQELTNVLRVLGISLIINGINNVQHAYVSKTLQFKRFFFSTLVGTVISGIVGIIMAYKGFGVWALVAQQLINAVMDVTILWFTVKWRPILAFSIKRLKYLFAFGWKLLISSLIDVLYTNLYGLLIGKIYDSNALGLYNKGRQFPNLIISNINGPIQSVLLPTIATEQDNKERVKSMVRRSIVTSSFIIFPTMIGMAAISKPIIIILLTEKWSACIPIMQISCITMALLPIHTANLQAITAMGRSDVFLKLEIIKKILGITVLIGSIPFGLYGMVWGGALVSVITTFINAYPNKKLLNYSGIEQWKDIMPSLVLSLVMGGVVLAIELLKWNVYITVVIQCIVGVIFYFSMAKIFKFECYQYLVEMLKRRRKK